MSKNVEVLLSRRVTIGVGEAAGDHEAGAKVKVSESVAESIVGQGAGVIVAAEKKPTAAEAKALAEAEAKALAEAEAKEAADKEAAELAAKEAADKAAADAAVAGQA